MILLALALALGAPTPLACPPGTEHRGAQPMEGFEEWCEAQPPQGPARREGPARRYYDDGSLWIESAYHDGLLEGLFVERHRFGEVLAAFQKEVLMAVDQDEHLGMLPDDLRTELMVDMWVYTHGLATLVISGTFPKPTVEAVDQKLSRVGGIVITAAMAAALPPVSGWRPVVANENKRTPKAPERRKG